MEIFQKKIGDFEYRVTSDWDNGDYIDDGSLNLGLKVERCLKKERGKKDCLAVDVKVSCEVTDQGLMATIYLNGDLVLNGDVELATLNLTQMFESETAIEAFVDGIPAYFFGGDPFLGCLVRSGLSGLLGQIIDCRNSWMPSEAMIRGSMERLEAVYQHGKDILRCVKKGLPKLGMRVAARFAKCLLKCGF